MSCSEVLFQLHSRHLQYLCQIFPGTEYLLSDMLITPLLISDITSNLDPQNGSEYNVIPADILNIYAPELTLVLSKLYTKCLATS